MQYFEHCGEVEIIEVSDFDPEKIFECGQCFRWDADDRGVYTGVAHGRAASLRRCGDSIFLSGSAGDFETVWRSYFDLDRDYTEIRKSLCVDNFMRRATAYGAGIRILKQDKWEALCSFIISQNNNIPRIKNIISRLCQNFGETLVCSPSTVEAANDRALDYKETRYYAFPSAAKLAVLEAEDLAVLRCGYRSDYIIAAARAVSAGEIDLDALSLSSPENAREKLKTLRGVGDKVADCVLLFGLHMLDAFPLDVWMKRAVAEHFGADFDPCLFSPYAGIAQQYIYHYIRSGA